MSTGVPPAPAIPAAQAGAKTAEEDDMTEIREEETEDGKGLDVAA
jgi:ribosomal protein L12E/L44/L45/RPP1/RPP2